MLSKGIPLLRSKGHPQATTHTRIFSDLQPFFLSADPRFQMDDVCKPNAVAQRLSGHKMWKHALDKHAGDYQEVVDTFYRARL